MLLTGGAVVGNYCIGKNYSVVDPVVINDNEPVVCIIDDDGSINFRRYLLPILENHEKTCSLAIITEFDEKTSLSWEELSVLSDKGFDIVSHSDDHGGLWFWDNKRFWTNIGKDSDAIEKAASKSYDDLKEHGLETDTMVYPFGARAKIYKSACDGFYNYGVTTEIGIVEGNTEIDSLAIPRIFINQENELDYYYEWIDKTIETNGLLVLGIHSGFVDEWSEEQVDAILDYIEYRGITYCTFEEAMELKTQD